MSPGACEPRQAAGCMPNRMTASPGWRWLMPPPDLMHVPLTLLRVVMMILVLAGCGACGGGGGDGEGAAIFRDVA